MLGRKEGNETDAPENCKAQEVAYSRVQQAPKRWRSVSGASADSRFRGLGMKAGTRRQRKEGRQRGGRWQKPLTREEEAEWTKEEAVHKASGSAPAPLKEQEGFLG